MTARPSVLVLTLYSGEAEYDQCRESLENQTYSHWEHRAFENLPDAEAHNRLYRTIMEQAPQYDLFLKLDADMVLADREVLSDLVGVFERWPDLDHLVVAVSDWMTDSFIIGVHLFSNRVSWKRHDDELYVDPDPVFPGLKFMVTEPPRDLVFHSNDPSPFQAFHFGSHRGLQAAQTYRSLRDIRPHDARLQWRYLGRVWRHFERSRDRRLGLALLAADMVFRKELPATANEYADPALLAAFEAVRNFEEREIRQRLMRRWGTPVARTRSWIRALGPGKSVLVSLRAIRDTAAFGVKTLIGRSIPSVEIGVRS